MAKGKVQVRSKVGEVLAGLDRAVRNNALLGDVAVFIRDRIYQNTKRGYYAGVRKNLAKFRPLSQNYVEYRKSLLGGEKKNAGGDRKKAIKKFGEFFSPARSNLTMTGQMLDALDHSVNSSAGQISVFVKPTQRSDDGDEKLTNAEVAKRVQDERPFLRLDETGVERVKRMVIADLRRRLKRR